MEIELLAPRKFQTRNTGNALRKLAKLLEKPVEKISPERIEDWSTFQYLIRARLPK